MTGMTNNLSSMGINTELAREVASMAHDAIIDNANAITAATYQAVGNHRESVGQLENYFLDECERADSSTNDALHVDLAPALNENNNAK